MSLTTCSRALEIADVSLPKGRTLEQTSRATMRSIVGTARRVLPATFIILSFVAIAAAVLALRAAVYVPGFWR